jgi:hypothetical protein
MSPSVAPAHHIVRSDHRNRLRTALCASSHRVAIGQAAAPHLCPRRGAATAELERDVIGALEPQDLARLIGGCDLKTQPFDDVARLKDLGGV